MRLIDSHCHLFFEALESDLPGVMSRAAGADVTKMINVGTSVADSHRAVDMAARFDNVWAAVGAHPHDGAGFLDETDPAGRLLDLARHDKVVAIGEIGLDYFKDYVDREIQKKILIEQLEATGALGLPYIFHVREAWSGFWPIFDRYPAITGVIHSFSDTSEHLDDVLKRGLYVGLNGIMTFTKDHAQLAAAKKVPLERLLLETDAPFLAPSPYRGQTCEPMHVRTTADFLADLRGEDVAELAQATTANAEELFRI